MIASGFVLAGGLSSRMGEDKAVLELGGATLVERAVATLRQVCGEVSIAAGDLRLARFAPVVLDEQRGLGPLSGIVAALTGSRTQWNVFLPVDTPFVPAAALERLLAEADDRYVGILSSLNGQMQPLCAVYSRAALATLRAELAADRRKVRVAIETAGPVKRVEFTEEAWFRNLNTPADLTAARGSVS